MCQAQIWSKEDDLRLARYVANCDFNELPDRKTMQILLRKVLDYERILGVYKKSN